MSVRTMAKVWADSKHCGTELLMLLAIADFADDDGYAYPAVGTLAAKCRMQPRNANYVLKALQDSGELQVRIGEGTKYRTNLYKINFEALGVQRDAVDAKPCRVQHGAHHSATHCSETLQSIADKPSINVQEPSNKKKPRTRVAPPPDRPEDVAEQVWKDWLTLRKAKKAPVTDTVLDSARSEATKAKMPLEAFLRVWCLRGSQGLQADWLKPEEKAWAGHSVPVSKRAGFDKKDYHEGVTEDGTLA